MRFRVRTDAAFPNQVDAEAFMVQARTFIARADSINEDKDNAEISFVDYEKCYHDEVPTRPCEKIERQEVHNGLVTPIRIEEILRIENS